MDENLCSISLVLEKLLLTHQLNKAKYRYKRYLKVEDGDEMKVLLVLILDFYTFCFVLTCH